jgi:hypothetical protein
MLLAVAALTSCSKFEQVPNAGETGSPVKLYGSIYTGTETRAIGDGVITTIPATSPYFEFQVYRADESAPSTYGAYASGADGVLAPSGTPGVGDITTSPALYYLPVLTSAATPLKSSFVGLYPRGGTLSSGQVTFTGLNGNTDIMCSDIGEGNTVYGGTSTGGLTLTFYHLLTKIKVELNAIGGSPAELAGVSAAWGTITDISVDDKKVDNIVVALPAPGSPGHGSVTATGAAADLPLTLPGGGAATAQAPGTGTAVTYGFAMFVPVQSPAQAPLKLLVTSAKIGQFEVDVPTQSWDAGTGYTITLEFSATSVKVGKVTPNTGTLDDWTEVTGPGGITI